MRVDGARAVPSRGSPVMAYPYPVIGANLAMIEKEPN
jgi:hypothetical protein